MSDFRLDIDLPSVDYTRLTPPMHVYPVGDPAHELHGWCWCQPLAEDQPTGGRIYIHRRSLDSPHIEKDF